MLWLEVINIRTAGSLEAERVLKFCGRICRSLVDENLLKLTVFSNATYDTDISIHLEWKSDTRQQSLLGKQMSSALADFGLINHSIWYKREECAPLCSKSNAHQT